MGFLDYFVNKDKDAISKLSGEVQNLIDILHSNESNNITFEQTGFIDGSTIVKEYVDEGEYELAVEHLLYMVYESDISYTDQILKQLNQLASTFNIKNNYL